MSNIHTFVRPSWVADELFPFQSRFMEIDGCAIHYVDEGSGPVLLFLHGNPTWSFLYRGIIKVLRHRFRCIAPDYPGFGLSAAREGYGFTPAEHSAIIGKFIEALELSDITMMVQDWGGPIGMGVAVRRPELFRAFIIGNTWGWPVNGDPHFERFSRFMGGSVGGFLIRHFNFFVNVVIPGGVKRKKPSQSVMDAYRAPFAEKERRKPMHIFPREILASRAFLSEVENGLPQLREKPALIVWGNKDIAFKNKELERWQTVFPGSRTVILDGAGHYIQEDAPEEIVSAINGWWK